MSSKEIFCKDSSSLYFYLHGRQNHSTIVEVKQYVFGVSVGNVFGDVREIGPETGIGRGKALGSEAQFAKVRVDAGQECRAGLNLFDCSQKGRDAQHWRLASDLVKTNGAITLGNFPHRALHS